MPRPASPSAAAVGERPPIAIWAVAAPVFVLIYWMRLTQHLSGDEVWFLQVVRRLTEGAELYQDVFFGVGPVSIWLAWGLLEVGGIRLAVVQLLPAAGYTFSVVGTALLVDKLGSRHVAAVLTIGLLPLAVVQVGIYQVLATSFMVAVALIADRWTRRQSRSTPEHSPDRWWLLPVIAGTVIGVTVCTKHNVGGLAGLALAAAWLSPSGGGPSIRVRIRSVTAAAVAAIVTVVILILPVATGPGAAGFLQQTITGKVVYLERAGVPYFSAVRTAIRQLMGGSSDTPLAAPVFLVPLAAVLIVPAALSTAGPDRARLIALASFAAASGGTLYPRGDLGHVAFNLPLMAAAALVGGWRLTRRTAVTRTAGLAAGWAITLISLSWICFRTVRPFVELAEGRLVAADVPHFRGTLLAPDTLASVHRVVDGISGSAASSVFFLAPDASLYVLAGDFQNPTPYDYPLANTFGPHGEEQVAEQLRNREISAVCMAEKWPENLEPTTLTRHVRSTMVQGADLGPCRMYFVKQPAPGS